MPASDSLPLPPRNAAVQVLTAASNSRHPFGCSMCSRLARMRKPDLATCDQRDRLSLGEDLEGAGVRLGSAFMRAAALAARFAPLSHVLGQERDHFTGG